MPDEELRARGRAIRRDLLGPTIDKLDEEVYPGDGIMTKFGDLTQDTIFGMLWSRDGIDLKTRTLITAVSDISTGQADALRLHLRFCRRHGWTEDELVEVMLHLTGYVGVPMIRQMLLVAKETFEEMETDGTLDDLP